MARIKVGIIGMGFIGVSHIEAIRRIGFLELVAVADWNYELAKKKAGEYYIPKCYATIDELLADPEIQAVHNCTPNNLHLEVNEKIIKAGKHVFSEKPLARTAGETKQMLELLKQNKEIVQRGQLLLPDEPAGAGDEEQGRQRRDREADAGARLVSPGLAAV